MRTPAGSNAGAGSSYVSTGHLPSPDRVAALVAEAHAQYKTNSEGENSQVYPALARVPSDAVRHLRGRHRRQRLRGRGCGLRILDHERVEAVRVRAGVSGARRGGGA